MKTMPDYKLTEQVQRNRPKSNGYMPLPAGFGKLFEVEGGPFDAFSGTGFGLCMEVRSREVANATVVIDVPDFHTPDPAELDKALTGLVDAMFKGRHTFIGCMGGFGRTGTAMACLAAAFGVTDPIRHVRRYYTPTAVETPEQRQFVLETWMPKTRKRIRINRLKSALPWLWVK